MPGNGVGDRDHNFFGQENLSQGQGRLEVVDRNWPGLSNNFLAGSQRQSGFPLNPDLKNYTVQQSDIDARHGTSFQVSHGLSFTQPNLQPEFNGSPFQNLPSLNGYIQGHHFFPAGQNEANLLGMDTESGQHNMGSRGLPVLDSQQGRDTELQKRNPVKSLNAETPVNFQLLGRQEQMGVHHPAVLQSFHGQQTSISDMQLLQQQLMLKQLRDSQRQQLQQQEVLRKSSSNNLLSMAKPALTNHSSMPLNGIPVNDGSNYSWQPGLSANANWVQRGAPAALQGSSGSLALSAEQGQGLRTMGLVSQQVDQSVYGVPHSGFRENPTQISQIEVDNSAMQQISSHVHSFSGSLYSSLQDQGSVQDGTMVPKQSGEVGHGLSSGFNSNNLRQANSPQGNAAMEELHGRQEFAPLSEATQGKSSSSVVPSQDVATLDPTEERILFGADDNVWGAFGAGTNTVAAGFNIGDSTGFLSGFPSVQSGSWSALMQSALAETSSDNQIDQEEWSGLSGQNARPSNRNSTPLTQNDGMRQQSAWSNNNMHTTSPSSRPLQLSDNIAKSGGSSGASRLWQSDLGASHGRSENMQTDSSERIENFQADSERVIHNFADGNRLFERSHLQRHSSDGSQICGNVSNASDAEGKKIISGSWTDPQSMFPSNHGDRHSRPNGWNVIDSTMPGEHANTKSHPREYSLMSSQDDNRNRRMHEEVGHEVAISRPDKVPAVALERVKSVDKQDSTLENAGISMSNRRDTRESLQQLPKSYGFDLWRPVDSTVKSKGSEVGGSNRNNMDRSVQVSDSPVNNRMHDMENSDKKDNLAGGFRLNTSHRSTGTFGNNVWTDAGESRNSREDKQNQFGQGAYSQRPAGTHKFQYHPMGNLDVDSESAYGTNHFALSRPMVQQVCGETRTPGPGQVGHSNFMDRADRSSAGMAKVDPKGGEAVLKGASVYTSDRVPPLERSVGTPSNNNAQSSQKMLELLHKVDLSREHGVASRFSSSDRNEANESETSDGSISHLQQSQSPASQGFGLQLAPPSQWLKNSDRALDSQSSSPALTAQGAFPYPREMGLSSLASTSLIQSASFRGTPQGEYRSNVPGTLGQISSRASPSNIEGNFGLPINQRLPFPRSHLQDQCVGAGGGAGHSICTSSDGFPLHPKGTDISGDGVQLSQSDLPSDPSISASASKANNAFAAEGGRPYAAKQAHSGLSQQFNPFEAVSLSQSSVNFGFPQQVPSSKVLPNLWNGSSSQQQLLGSVPGNDTLRLLESHLKSNSKVESSYSGTSSGKLEGLVPEEQAVKECSSEMPDPVQSSLQVNEALTKHVSDASLPKPASSQGEIEAFGHYLKPNDFVNRKYSLLHQVQATKSMEGDFDHDERSTKRLKGPESCLDSQPVSLRGEKHVSHGYGPLAVENSAGHTPVRSGDTAMLSFSVKPGDNQGIAAASPDIAAFHRNEMQSSSTSSNLAAIRGDHPNISPQMAPSWFEQYGTLKNGQVLQTYDARKMAAFGASPLGSVCNSMAPSSTTSEHHLLPPEAMALKMLMKSKKRKHIMCGSQSWHKEMAEGARSIQDVSVADAEWAMAANMLVEKVDSEGDMNEDGMPMQRPKRRLSLTTQLMQLILRPPPALFLTADAASQYENVAYFTSRLTLGDTCGIISCSSSVPVVSPESENSLFKITKEAVHPGDERLTKVVEELVGRTRNLENELSRLDKRSSIVDLRVECQDLEKFSVINRFAKFHGRGQVDGTGTSSSDASSALKVCPQRYVTALPIPRNLPDRVQCLPL
ncbi:uncharacterized protein LOC115692499 isoform X1 [Syzygium oleosum]|uniref:uncharacterized protein LOC115692499 isoform X1 n=1 Tax=Syzygium oleosum TaxID=219896 RepID=UPI0024B9BD55|nr:uncharacterized protein LOC115692499 isoform X1 [Syzygium oleosum]